MEAQAVYDLAIRLLAGRSYSQAELTRRLLAAGADPEAATAAVALCLGEGALNDADFALEKARKRLHGNRRGPELVRAELRHLGLDDDVIEAALGDIDPLALAADALRRRFGPPPDATDPLPFREVRRRADYLRRRGFDEEIIGQLLASG